MKTVRLSERAEHALVAIVEYLLEKTGPVAANKHYRSFGDLWTLLASHPESGATMSRLGQGISLNVVEPYNVHSLNDAATHPIRILCIMHGRRKITRTMTQFS